MEWEPGGGERLTTSTALLWLGTQGSRLVGMKGKSGSGMEEGRQERKGRKWGEEEGAGDTWRARTRSRPLGRALGVEVEMWLPGVLCPVHCPLLLSSRGWSTPNLALTTQGSVGSAPLREAGGEFLEALIRGLMRPWGLYY
jgi:hypothetical protein